MALTGLLPALVALSGGFSGPQVGPLEDEGKAQLARVLITRARQMLDDAGIIEGEFAAAAELSRIAVELAPDSEDAWRLWLTVLDADRTADPLESRRALDAIARLAPADTVVRLRRLLSSVDSRQSAAGREQALNHLIDQASAIGGPTASRLALDLAMLQSRVGDAEGFAASLRRAVELDPWFPAAVEALAGETAAKGAAPVEVAKGLVAAYLANPASSASLARLGALLMQERDYPAARPVLETAAAIGKANAIGLDQVESFRVDVALAFWATGDLPQALRLLTDCVRERDEEHRANLIASRSGLTELEISRQQASLPPTLALSFLAVASEVDPAKANLMLTRTLELARSEIAAAKERKRQSLLPGATTAFTDADASGVRDAILDLVRPLPLLGGSGPEVLAIVESLEGVAPLPERALTALKAIASASGEDAAAARAALEAIPDRGPVEELALARAMERLGQRREAAGVLREVMRESPGTLVGISAERALAGLLGVPALPAGETNEAMLQAEQAMPADLLRASRGEAPGVHFRVVPRATRAGPFEPIVMDLVIEHSFGRPMAIEPDGPIRAMVTLGADLSVPGSPKALLSEPSVVMLDRALEVESGVPFTLPVEITLLPKVADEMRRSRLSGALMEVRCLLNFVASELTLRPGCLGAPAQSTTVRISGIDVSDEWVTQAIASARAGETGQALRDWVLLALAASADDGSGDAARASRAAKVWDALREAWPTLPIPARAWIMLEGPTNSAGFDSLYRQAVASSDLLLRLAAALGVDQSSDEALVVPPDASPALRTILEGMKARLLRISETAGTIG